MKELSIDYIDVGRNFKKSLKIKLDNAWYEKLKDKKLKVRAQYDNGLYYFYYYEKGKYYHVHRLVAGAEGARDSVDHVNRDTLDNRSSNLRVCTHQQNSRNRWKTRFNKTGFKGVYARSGSKFFSASIQDGDVKWISNGHGSAKEAAVAYDRLAKLLHEEYASLNFE